MERTFDLLPADALSAHEETDPERTAELCRTLERDGYLASPVVVDREHRVILDGHHRWAALRALGCAKVPVYLVDYESDDVRVSLWDGAPVASVTKEEVVERGRSGRLFPPKTTRHRFAEPMPTRRVALEELGGGKAGAE